MPLMAHQVSRRHLLQQSHTKYREMCMSRS